MRIYIVSGLFFLSVAVAWKCDLEDTRYLGQNATLVQAVSVYPVNPSMNVTVVGNMTISGTMRVVDACTFAIDNFVFLPGLNGTISNDTFWYGIRDETYNKGKISDKAIEVTNGTTVLFSFVDAPVARSWDDIDTLVLYSEKSAVALAYSHLNLTEIRKIRNATATSTETVPATSIPTSSANSTASSSGFDAGNTSFISYAMWLSSVALGCLLL